ncbi:unnamed protein product [Sphagnum troendelagicum]|uniref:Uncharacterized protein n=1 Tax=Sphagnum troendelagicum TaxID=128251 RepID=A0ABP0U509_9BRYO
MAISLQQVTCRPFENDPGPELCHPYATIIEEDTRSYHLCDMFVKQVFCTFELQGIEQSNQVLALIKILKW